MALLNVEVTNTPKYSSLNRYTINVRGYTYFELTKFVELY